MGVDWAGSGGVYARGTGHLFYFWPTYTFSKTTTRVFEMRLSHQRHGDE